MGRRGNDEIARRRPEQERSKERVEAILRSARALLQDGGVRALSTTSIARRAGVPVGSIYQYYPNRNAILQALFEDYLGRIQAVLHDWEQNGPYEGGWRAFFEKLYQRLKRAEGGSRLGNAWTEAALENPELAALGEQHAEIIAAASARMLRRFGSRWPDAKLRRLSLYYYRLNVATLYHEQQQKNVRAQETLEWGAVALLSLLEHCLPQR
jgi:AcrR family transcriptional regulator